MFTPWNAKLFHMGPAPLVLCNATLLHQDGMCNYSIRGLPREMRIYLTGVKHRPHTINKEGNMRRSVSLVLIILSVLFWPQISAAGNFKFGGGVGFVMANENAEGGFSYNGYFIYQMDNMFSFITSVGRYGTNTIYRRLSQGGYSRLSDGDYSLLLIEASVLIRKQRQGLQPYIGGGAGYYITEHGLSTEAKTWLATYHLQLEEEIDDILSVHLIIGFMVPVTTQVSVDANFKYVFLKPTLHGTLTDLDTSEKYYRTEQIDLGVKGLSVGISLVF